MEHLIQLNLQSDSQKAELANLPNPEHKEVESPVLSKRLHRLVNKAAHKAASEFGRSKSGIFSK